MKQEARKNFLINTFYFLTVTAGVFIFFRFLLKYLTPFIIGGLIAWLVQKPAVIISKKTGLKRFAAAPVLALAAFLLAAGLCVFLGFKLVEGAGGLISEISGYAGKLSVYFEDIKDKLDLFFEDLPKELTVLADNFYEKVTETLLTGLTTLLSDFAAYLAKRAPAFLVSCIVSAVASCYIAADFPGLVRFIRSLFGRRFYENTLKVKNIFVNSVFKFIKGYAILMLITFLELLAGLYILRIKYAPLLAALISVIDILPVLGTGTVLVPWAAAELLARDTAAGIGLLVLYAVITVIRNFAEPKIIGKEMGINPLFTLLAMFIGLKLFGFAGILLLPITLIVVVKYYKDEMEAEENTEEETTAAEEEEETL